MKTQHFGRGLTHYADPSNRPKSDQSWWQSMFEAFLLQMSVGRKHNAPLPVSALEAPMESQSLQSSQLPKVSKGVVRNNQSKSQSSSQSTTSAIKKALDKFYKDRKENPQHQPVMLEEAVKSLNIKPDGLYVDATCGRCGHSALILEKLGQKGRLLMVDKDEEAIQYAKKYFGHLEQVKIVHSSFAHIAQITQQMGWYGRVNGLIADLGVSSNQLDCAERGFSFQKDARLDMRMDQTQSMDACEWLNKAPQEELVEVFYRYGEERKARQIAKALVIARQSKVFHTTTDLSFWLAQHFPNPKESKHPATRIFQAIRIHINRELEELDLLLSSLKDLLAIKARVALICFHSLEAKRVKSQFKPQVWDDKWQSSWQSPQLVPPPVYKERVEVFKVLKTSKPTKDEIETNPRSRSAWMRVVEKVEVLSKGF